jgi:predicted oxidoreductase
MSRLVIPLVFCVGLAASTRGPSAQQIPSADAIVVGAGLAGLSAAIEMGRAGVNVLVVDMNSVAGGHAVLAGGVAIAGTPVQEKAGIKDSPDLAYRDWMEWTADGDPAWTRYYAENSRPMIYDWVTAMGVEFVRAGAANGNSVPRFHFTKGRALHLVMPMFRTALALPKVAFVWNARAERLIVEQGAEGNTVTGVEVRHLRTGRTEILRASHTVLATGGFESDLDRVLGNWTPGLPRPARLLVGSAISATGSGHDMATAAGAALSRIDRHYIYIDGLPDPRDPEGIHALTGGNGRAMWVNAQGRRFTNESGWDKRILVDLLNQEPSTYWAIFDETARDAFGVRGAAWVSTPMEGHPILDNPKSAHKASSLDALAKMAGLPPGALEASVRRFNSLVAAGADADFGRFKPGDRLPATIERPPFYAVQFFPMTRKNMGGVSIDMGARVLDRQRRVVPGLYAAGELTGSVGINGSHGMDGMFLGPAIITGRLAGRSVASAVAPTISSRLTVVEADLQVRPGIPNDGPGGVTLPKPLPPLTSEFLAPLLAKPRDGYWHFEQVHRTVIERRYECTRCHSAQLPFAPVTTREQRAAQIELCVNCH